MKYTPHILGLLIAAVFLFLGYSVSFGPHPGLEQTALFGELGKPGPVTYSEEDKALLRKYYSMSFVTKPHLLKLLSGICLIFMVYCILGLFYEHKRSKKDE